MFLTANLHVLAVGDARTEQIADIVLVKDKFEQLPQSESTKYFSVGQLK